MGNSHHRPYYYSGYYGTYPGYYGIFYNFIIDLWFMINLKLYNKKDIMVTPQIDGMEEVVVEEDMVEK